MTSSAPKSAALRTLYWRSEILRVVYWLYGEGLGDIVDVDLIREYLDLDAGENLATYLDQLVEDGSLVADGNWYALSARAMADGEARLATAFTDLVRPVASECDGDCWCQTSAAEAQACAAARANPRPAREHEAGKANA